MEQWLGTGGFNVPVKEKGSRAFYPQSEISPGPFGTGVMFGFTLGGERLKFFNELTGELQWGVEDRFQIPVATMVDHDRDKDVIKTKIRGNQGTVKEMYAFGDWNISIRGLLFDERGSNGTPAGRTAVELKRKLMDFEQYADSIPVQGWLFTEMKVNRIVIEQLRFRQIEGKPWVIGFEMSCVSDNSPELDIQAGKQYRRVL
ncbi:hypothetical protein D3C72_535490 [compost metagenome]